MTDDEKKIIVDRYNRYVSSYEYWNKQEESPAQKQSRDRAFIEAETTGLIAKSLGIELDDQFAEENV